MTTKIIKRAVRLLKLRCIAPNENDGDEIYIKLPDNKKLFPKEKYVKATAGVSIDLKSLKVDTADGMQTIELWDYNLLKDTKVGTFTFLVSDQKGEFTSDLKSLTSGKYCLDFEIY